jgi:hypothetical protein
MALSNAHRWGQTIGNVFRASVRDLLSEVADQYGLYLDAQGLRPARPGKKVQWQDRFGNIHDLDYVFERGGSETVRGVPAAFIETAWRRYAKHAKNKAQEIEGALAPLQQTYYHLHPFLGAVLAGDFTQPSLSQWRSRGFEVLHFPTASIFAAFEGVGIDATSTEQTTEEAFAEKIRRWQALTPNQQRLVELHLWSTQADEVGRFRAVLAASLSRAISDVLITIWHGTPRQVRSIADAVAYLLAEQSDESLTASIERYEIEVRYTNGDVIHASFHEQRDAIAFLESFE